MDTDKKTGQNSVIFAKSVDLDEIWIICGGFY